MKSVLRRRNFVTAVLILVVGSLGVLWGGDVVVKEGAIEGAKFKGTDCTASGTKAVALGYGSAGSGSYSTAMGASTTASGASSTAMGGVTTASGNYSTAMGYTTDASGAYSTAMGNGTEASGEGGTAIGYGSTASAYYSTAIGYSTEASHFWSTAVGYATKASGLVSTAMGLSTEAGTANYTTAIGSGITNNVQSSFAVGYDGAVDFRVTSGEVRVGDPCTVEGVLVVGNYVDANDFYNRSSFYDKGAYGKGLDYAEDSSKTIKVGADGKRQYNHEGDPEFLQGWVTVTDYDKYTEKEVWDERIQRTVTTRIYQTHQERRTSIGMQVGWLRQCVFELKQENETLKDEIAKLKPAVGVD